MHLTIDPNISFGEMLAAVSIVLAIGGLCRKLSAWHATTESHLAHHDKEIEHVTTHASVCDTDRSEIRVRVAALDERTELMLGHKEA